MSSTNLAAEFECPVCLELPKVGSKIYQCRSGHIICETCNERLDVCPTCRAKLDSIRSIIAEKSIAQLARYQIDHVDDLKSQIKNVKQSFIQVCDQIEEIEKKVNEMKIYSAFTNVYVTSFVESTTREDLQNIFEKFGEISSIKLVISDEDGKNKRYAFVAFYYAESAESACAQLNGTEVNGKIIYVRRAQKKAEREIELKKRFGQKKLKQIHLSRDCNLYVKNLDDIIDDEKLRTEFAPFGTITSAKVMKEEGRSKGVGFVCFSSPVEATKAVKEMNGRIIVSKPLYVGLAQRKEDRKAQNATILKVTA